MTDGTPVALPLMETQSPISAFGLVCIPIMLEFNECNNFGYFNKYLYIDTIIISEDFVRNVLVIVW